MTDQEKLEKVIKGLECCILGNKHEPDCDVCPYSAGCNDTCDTMDEIHADALALLKGQEPVEPTWRRGLAFCSSCGRQFCHGFKYCPDCGRPVKWDG